MLLLELILLLLILVQFDRRGRSHAICDVSSSVWTCEFLRRGRRELLRHSRVSHCDVARTHVVRWELLIYCPSAALVILYFLMRRNLVTTPLTTAVVELLLRAILSFIMNTIGLWSWKATEDLFFVRDVLILSRNIVTAAAATVLSCSKPICVRVWYNCGRRYRLEMLESLSRVVAEDRRESCGRLVWSNMGCFVLKLLLFGLELLVEETLWIR